jgi:hypothetical protein
MRSVILSGGLIPVSAAFLYRIAPAQPLSALVAAVLLVTVHAVISWRKEHHNCAAGWPADSMRDLRHRRSRPSIARAGTIEYPCE